MPEKYVCKKCGIDRTTRFPMAVHMMASHSEQVTKFVSSHIEEMVDFVDFVEVEDA